MKIIEIDGWILAYVTDCTYINSISIEHDGGKDVVARFYGKDGDIIRKVPIAYEIGGRYNDEKLIRFILQHEYPEILKEISEKIFQA